MTTKDDGQAAPMRITVDDNYLQSVLDLYADTQAGLVIRALLARLDATERERDALLDDAWAWRIARNGADNLYICTFKGYHYELAGDLTVTRRLAKARNALAAQSKGKTNE
jgi:hypothetical protein